MLLLYYIISFVLGLSTTFSMLYDCITETVTDFMILWLMWCYITLLFKFKIKKKKIKKKDKIKEKKNRIKPSLSFITLIPKYIN